MLNVFYLILWGVILWLFFRWLWRKIKTRPEKVLEIEKEVWKFANVYKRREYLFYSVSEFSLFKLLNELYGDKFYIFPQINLGHLIQPKDQEFFESRRQRSRIEKKSVDFVLCDKIRVVPQLVIESDGFTHDRADRKSRDNFVDSLMKDVDLPILHIKTGKMDRGFIKSEVDKALGSR